MPDVAAHARLALATHNAHKVGEILAILRPLVPGLHDGDVVTAGELGAPEPVEDGVTFEANALIKARALCAASGLPALADDSGIAVDVLGGSPGVFSKGWAGSRHSDANNLQLLLEQIEDVPDDYRSAQFVCAAALVTPEGLEYVEVGRVRGRLLRAPAGDGGFGYDPAFVADGQNVTNAQLSPDAKNEISHRGAAFRSMAPHLVAVLEGS